MIPYLILGAYLLMTLLTGLMGYRQRKDTPDDYFLAGRSVGAWVLFMTLIATNFSAFTFLGFSGEGYRVGLSFYPMMAFGTALVAIAFFLIGDRVWRLGQAHGFITPAELIGDRFRSPALKQVFLAVMVIFTLPYLTLQPIGAGYLLESVTNGQIPYFVGATGLTAVIVAYVFVGGMRSVAFTDVLQGCLMFVLMFVALGTIAHQLGGFATANQAAYDLKPELLSRQGVDQFFTPRKWFSFMCLWFLSVPMFPQMFMRFYTPKTPKALQTSAILYPLITVTLFICPVSIGMWGHIPFPELTGKAADQIFPMMLAEYTPNWLAALVMVGAIAAFMSTLDSQLLALSSMITRDIYVSALRPHASLQEQTLVGRILIVILAIIGLAIAFNPPDTIAAIATQAFTGLAVLFPTVIAALYCPKASALSCILSICVGEALVIGFQMKWIPEALAFGFLPVVPVVALSSLIIAVGSQVMPHRSPAT